MPKPQYGAAHQKQRREWKTKVDRGNVACYRCGEPITPGTPWDLGHDDDDPTITRGPEHRKCNRGTARIWKNKAEQKDYQWFT